MSEVTFFQVKNSRVLTINRPKIYKPICVTLRTRSEHYPLSFTDNENEKAMEDKMSQARRHQCINMICILHIHIRGNHLRILIELPKTLDHGTPPRSLVNMRSSVHQ